MVRRFETLCLITNVVFESRMQCLRVLRHFLHSEIPILEWDRQYIKALALDRCLLRHLDSQIPELDRQHLKVMASDRLEGRIVEWDQPHR